MNFSVGPKHTGEAPAHRPPDSEPERVGEGELDEEPPRDPVTDLTDETGEGEDVLESD